MNVREALGRSSAARTLFKSSTWMMGGYVIQIACQMLLFVELAWHFGPAHFGRLAATLAAINLISPLAGMGSSEVLLLKVSQDRNTAANWYGNAMLMTISLGLACTLGLAMLAAFLDSDRCLAPSVVSILAVSELVCVRSCTIAGRLFQATDRVNILTWITVAVAASKATAVTCIAVIGVHSVLTWALLHFFVLASLSIFIFVKTRNRFGISLGGLDWLRTYRVMSAGFTFSTIAKACYSDMDKLLLARWATSAEVGLYTAGYKILTFAFLPIRSILEVTAVKQFQLGESSPERCRRLTQSILLANLTLSLIAAGLLYFTSPFLVIVMGSSYAGASSVIALGCFLPVIQTLHYTYGNYLTAIGSQSIRSAMQFAVVAIYLLLGVKLIPQFGWSGAIATSLISESTLVVMLATTCFIMSKEEYKSEAPDSILYPSSHDCVRKSA